jgi:hypothetical protein
MIMHADRVAATRPLCTPGTVLDQRPQDFAGEPTNLYAKMLGLCVEL